MKNLIALVLAALLAACGGSGDPVSSFTEPKAFKLASPVSGYTEIALHLHQALYGKAPVSSNSARSKDRLPQTDQPLGLFQ